MGTATYETITYGSWTYGSQQWAPTTTDVASLMFARVAGEFGGMEDFTATSRPTKEQVAIKIGQAVSMVAVRVGFSLDVQFHEAARFLTVLYVALFTEAGFWPEDLKDYRSAQEVWQKLYDDGMETLLSAIAEAGAGGEVGPADDRGHVAYFFPGVPRYARRDVYGCPVDPW